MNDERAIQLLLESAEAWRGRTRCPAGKSANRRVKISQSIFPPPKNAYADSSRVILRDTGGTELLKGKRVWSCAWDKEDGWKSGVRQRSLQGEIYVPFVSTDSIFLTSYVRPGRRFLAHTYLGSKKVVKGVESRPNYFQSLSNCLQQEKSGEKMFLLPCSSILFPL